MKRLTLSVLSVACLALAGCGGDDTATSDATDTSGTDTSGTDTSSTDSGSTDSSGTASGIDLCTAITAATVGATLAADVAEARPMTVGERTQAELADAPSCAWLRPDGFAAMTAEVISPDRYATVIADTSLGLQPLDGVGDEAFSAPDMVDPTLIAAVYTTASGQHWLINFSARATPEQATILSSTVLGV